jgi:hypothetical protein
MPELPAIAPLVSPETKQFWDATAEGKLLVPKCGDCGNYFWYPRGICPDCHGNNIEWPEASGRGTIYTFSIMRRGMGPYANAAPYVLAYVTLEEGPTMLTNIVTEEPDTLKIGDPVTVVFHDTGEGNAIPRFVPAGS